MQTLNYVDFCLKFSRPSSFRQGYVNTEKVLFCIWDNKDFREKVYKDRSGFCYY